MVVVFAMQFMNKLRENMNTELLLTSSVDYRLQNGNKPKRTTDFSLHQLVSVLYFPKIWQRSAKFNRKTNLVNLQQFQTV